MKRAVVGANVSRIAGDSVITSPESRAAALFGEERAGEVGTFSGMNRAVVVSSLDGGEN